LEGRVQALERGFRDVRLDLVLHGHMEAEGLCVLAGEVCAPSVLQSPVEHMCIRSSEPVGDASSERNQPGDIDGERQGRGQPAELRLDVVTEVAGKRVEQRDVRPYRGPAPREHCGSLGLEALTCRAIESQRYHERPLVTGPVIHRRFRAATRQPH
jgi:hypothetical protein